MLHSLFKDKRANISSIPIFDLFLGMWVEDWQHSDLGQCSSQLRKPVLEKWYVHSKVCPIAIIEAIRAPDQIKFYSKYPWVLSNKSAKSFCFTGPLLITAIPVLTMLTLHKQCSYYYHHCRGWESKLYTSHDNRRNQRGKESFHLLIVTVVV